MPRKSPVIVFKRYVPFEMPRTVVFMTDAQMESAVKKADEGSTITIKATSSTTVTLPVGGMADAADNDNDVPACGRHGRRSGQ